MYGNNSGFFDREGGKYLSDGNLKNQLPAPNKGVFGYYYTLLKNPRKIHTYGWEYFIPNGFRDKKMPFMDTDTPGFPEEVYVLVTTSESMALVPATDENWAGIRKAKAQLHEEYGRALGLTSRDISRHFAPEKEDTLVEKWFYFKFDPVEGKLRFWLARPDVAGEELRKHHGKPVFSQDNDLITLEDKTRLILNWTFYLPNREPLFLLNKKDMHLWMEYFWNKWRISVYNCKNKKHPALQEATAFGGAVKACIVNLGCKHYNGACSKLKWRSDEPG